MSFSSEILSRYEGMDRLQSSAVIQISASRISGISSTMDGDGRGRLAGTSPISHACHSAITPPATGHRFPVFMPRSVRHWLFASFFRQERMAISQAIAL
jgi:hypothetical protein